MLRRADPCRDGLAQARGTLQPLPADRVEPVGDEAILVACIAGGEMQLAIGIGVNLRAAPAQDEVEPRALRPVSLLTECGVYVTAEEFLTPLAAAYAAYEARFVAFGFDPIRRLWLDRAAHRGETITARVGAMELRGRFVDVDKDGQLVLETRDGRMTIPAAEVYF